MLPLARSAFPFVFAGLVASAAFAAPPEGKGKPDKGDPPADFTPEILYKSDGQKSEDILLANREGDQAVLVYRGSKSTGDQLDASSNSVVSPQPNMLAYSDSGTVYLASWSDDAGFALEEGQPIHQFSGRAGGLAFSHGDDALAMAHDSVGLYIYAIPAGNIHGGSVTQHIGDDFHVISPRWSPDDRYIYFYGGPEVAQQWVTGLYRYEVATDALVKIMDRTENQGLYLDVGAGPGGSTLIATKLNGVLQLYDGDANPVAMPYAPEGDEFVFNCDATKVIHSLYVRFKPSLAISDLNGGTEIWASGKVRPFTAWIPRDPCG